MRLPFSKAYRAFPELDAFSDEECERFVERVTGEARWRRRRALLDLLSIVAGPPIGFVASAIVYRVTEPLSVAASFLSVSGVIIAVVVAVLFMRDGLLRRYLAQRLSRAECRACRYSLLGLAVTGGAVRCPECGAVTVLAERGLSEEDLMIPRRSPADGAGGAG
jgi:hypothetical protein